MTNYSLIQGTSENKTKTSVAINTGVPQYKIAAASGTTLGNRIGMNDAVLGADRPLGDIDDEVRDINPSLKTTFKGTPSGYAADGTATYGSGAGYTTTWAADNEQAKNGQVTIFAPLAPKTDRYDQLVP